MPANEGNSHASSSSQLHPSTNMSLTLLISFGIIVTVRACCQIYDAGDFSLLCSESARRGERWMGGEFIALDRVAVWSSDGRGYLYKLPTK